MSAMVSSWSAMTLPMHRLAFPFRFFGVDYSSVYVNNNGLISLKAKVESFSPIPFPIAGSNPMIMIAPFWADVDTRSSTVVSSPIPNIVANRVYYRVDNSTDSSTQAAIQALIRNHFPIASAASFQPARSVSLQRGIDSGVTIATQVCSTASRPF